MLLALPAAPAVPAPVAAVVRPSTIPSFDRRDAIVPGDPQRSVDTAIESVIKAVKGVFGRGPEAPLPTAGPVDLARYAGKWFELARLPTRFQDPRSVSTAEYGVRPDGKVSVDNTAFVGDRVSARISGTATPVAGAPNDRLRVKFGGFLKFIPTPKEGNYWVIDLEDDYSMALVGTPDRSNLWLLSRDANAWDSTTAARMVAEATKLGFDTDKLLIADWTRREMRPRA